MSDRVLVIGCRAHSYSGRFHVFLESLTYIKNPEQLVAIVSSIILLYMGHFYYKSFELCLVSLATQYSIDTSPSQVNPIRYPRRQPPFLSFPTPLTLRFCSSAAFFSIFPSIGSLPAHSFLNFCEAFTRRPFENEVLCIHSYRCLAPPCCASFRSRSPRRWSRW